MSDEPRVDPSCQVCERRLLPGERPTQYLTREGTEVLVCELCRPRAEAAGWLRPHEAEARGGVGRERRRPRGQMLGGLLGRLPASGNGASEPEAEVPVPRRRRSAAPSRSTSPGRVGTPDGSADAEGTSVSEALFAFNASNHRRTVAGLTRTLGPPRASGLAVQASNGHPGARLTVAWELTWYQWEVGAGSRGPEVRESGKGETIDQLRAADRTWNLLVASDGTLEQRVARPEDAGGEAS